MCPYFGTRGARPPLGILPCAGAPSALSFLAEGGFKTRLDVAGRIEMTLLRSPALRRRLICAFVDFYDSMASPLDRCTKPLAGPPHTSFSTAHHSYPARARVLRPPLLLPPIPTTARPGPAAHCAGRMRTRPAACCAGSANSASH